MKIFSKSIIFMLIVANFSCGKTCREASYSFAMSEIFYPEMDSIAVGDTIWVTSSHSTIFKDSITGTNVDYSGSSIGLTLRLLNLTNATQLIGGFPNFATVIINGSAVGGDNLPAENKAVYYQQSNNFNLLKVLFVAKEKGLFGISLGNSGAIRRKGHDCESATIEVANSNNDTHYKYYEMLFPNGKISDYEKKHVYYVLVH